MKLHLTVDRDGEDFDVIADVEYHRAYRGQRDSCGGVRGAGPPLEPDEPEHFEINRVTDADGNEIDVDKKTKNKFLRMPASKCKTMQTTDFNL